MNVFVMLASALTGIEFLGTAHYHRTGKDFWPVAAVFTAAGFCWMFAFS